MPEITEVLEDFSDNTKKLFKNKKFLVAAGAVAVVALVVGLKKNQQETDSATGYEAIGYGGYPTTGGASSSDSIFTGEGEGAFLGDSSYYDELTTEYDGVLSDMESNILMLSDRLISAEESSEEYLYQIERQNAISQMRANSELYNALSSPENADTRAALHEENKAIAERFGWTFDNGNWFEGNTVLYTSAKQQAAGITPTRTATSSNETFVNNSTYTAKKTASVTSGGGSNVNSTKSSSSQGFDPNIDYSLAIKDAQSRGASASEIAALQTARQAKIDAVYGGVDPAKTTKTTTSTVGKVVSPSTTTYTVSSNRNPVTVTVQEYTVSSKRNPVTKTVTTKTK